MKPERPSASLWSPPAWAWLSRWVPTPLSTSRSERLRVVVGALLGILFTAIASQWWAPAAGVWLVAPIGASAVLVFSAPSSPLAQPWAVVAGNTVSAAVGWCCVQWLSVPLPWAVSVAVAAAIGAMMALRCLHPPGGAMALLMVWLQESHWSFLFFPVFTNSVLLVLVAVLYNHWTHHPYPHKPSPVVSPPAAGQVGRADLDTVVARYGQVLDVAPDELVNLLREAQGMATERLWRTLVCRDIMSPHPVFVDFKTSLSMAMQRMTQAQIKALPVVDQGGQVVGILTQADFLRLLSADASVEQDRSVGEFMTRQVRVASAHSHALDLLPLFSSGGHHHLPVIDQDKRLVGMLTQTDLVRALSRVLTRPGEHGAAQTAA